MFRYYQKAVLLPLAISVVATLVYSAYDNRNYKSEWFTREWMIQMSFVFALFYGILLCILCLPILLVRQPRVRTNVILTFLCWFGLPVGFMTAYGLHEIRSGSGADGDLIYVAIMNIPFLAGLIWTYGMYLIQGKGEG